MFIETLYYRGVGIKKEFPELNPVAAALLRIGILWHTKKHHSVVEGYPLPREGTAIITGNHCSQADIYEAGLAGQKSGRLIRTVLKKSLIEKGAYESDEYLNRIGDKKDSADYSPLSAFVMRGVGGIPILRDNPGINFARTCYQVLNSNQLLGIFLQGSRDEDGLLRNLEPGVAFLASKEKYHNVPIHPIAFSKDRALLLEPLTYNQLRDNLGREIDIPELTILITDRIAAALSTHVQAEWQEQRENELRRLIASKR